MKVVNLTQQPTDGLPCETVDPVAVPRSVGRIAGQTAQFHPPHAEVRPRRLMAAGKRRDWGVDGGVTAETILTNKLGDNVSIGTWSTCHWS